MHNLIMTFLMRLLNGSMWRCNVGYCFIKCRLRSLTSLWLIVLFSFSLASCSSYQLNHQSEDIDWQIAGKISIKPTSEKLSFGLFNWQQHGQAFEIRLFDPLGRPRMTLTGDQLTAQLSLADGQLFSADSAEQLMHDNLGWSFPVNSVRLWLQGQPSMAAVNAVYTNGDLQQFNTA